MVFKISKTAIALVLFGLIAAKTGEARTHHYSFYSDDPAVYLKPIERYEEAPADKTCLNGSGDVRAGIVTHHLLAVDLMTGFFACLSRHDAPDRIILIGPDHYAQTLAGISVASLPWKTPFGEMAADAGTATAIKEALDLKDDNEAFSGEHSIGVLVPFIRYYFPKSRIVPVIVQRNVGFDKLIRLKTILADLLDDPKTLILLSMDFSHNQTSAEADLRDERARGVIENLDYRQTDRLDIDCHPGLKVLLAALQERRNVRPQILSHSNSARLTGKMDISNVTSYFTILFYESPDGTKHKGASE